MFSITEGTSIHLHKKRHLIWILILFPSPSWFFHWLLYIPTWLRNSLYRGQCKTMEWYLGCTGLLMFLITRKSWLHTLMTQLCQLRDNTWESLRCCPIGWGACFQLAITNDTISSSVRTRQSGWLIPFEIRANKITCGVSASLSSNSSFPSLGVQHSKDEQFLWKLK